MKKRLSLFIIALTAISQLLTANGIYAEPFTRDHFTARTAGMGNAFTGLADDAGAVWFNPAGTSWLEHPQGMFSIMAPYVSRPNADYYNAQSFALVFPYEKEMAWGLGWNRLGVKNNYQENTFLLNFSGKLNPIVPLAINDLYFGFNLKGLIYSPSVAGQDIFDDITDGTSAKSAFGADAGVLYKANRDFSLGLSVMNINRPVIDIADDFKRVPVESRLGAAYNLLPAGSLDSIGIDQITPTLDLVRRKDKWESNLGTEISFFKDRFALRGGVNSDEATAGISLRNMKVNNYVLNFSYSFSYSYGLASNDRLHMVSINLIRNVRQEPAPPPAKEAKTSPYRFGPNDVIQIITRNHDEFSGTYTIDPYGKILIPLIGEILIEGLTKDEMTAKLRQEIGKYVQDASVLVTTVKYRSNIVYVLGEVRTPGKYPIQGDFISLRDAIADAGLPTGLAATWRVYIIKPSTYRPTYRIVNFYNVLYRGKLANNVLLTPDDVVYVPTTILGKISTSLSYLLDPFFKTRSVATPLASPKPLLEDNTTTTTTTSVTQ